MNMIIYLYSYINKYIHTPQTQIEKIHFYRSPKLYSKFKISSRFKTRCNTNEGKNFERKICCPYLCYLFKAKI